MGGALGCLKEDSIKQQRNISSRNVSILSQAEEKTVQVSYTSDPAYFDRLAIFLNKLPRTNRPPADQIISVVINNPRYVPNIISLLLYLESQRVFVEIGMVVMITQQGEYAKQIGDAIFLLQMHQIKIRRRHLIEIMANASDAITIAHKIIHRYQRSSMASIFAQLQAEKEEMTTQLDIMYRELQAAEKKKVDVLVKQLVNERPVFESSRPSSLERKLPAAYFHGEEIECSFFLSSSQRKTNVASFSTLKKEDLSRDNSRYPKSGNFQR